MSEREHHILRKPGAHPIRSLADYQQHAGGYRALAHALEKLTPDQALDEVSRSGLRGRGGAGVMVGEKWRLARHEPERPKYLICNAYDADLLSQISRTILAENPHQMIESMALAAYAIGAQETYLFTRSLYTTGIAAVQAALQEALDAKLLGRNVLGSQFTCSITLVAVDVGFMGGEETTLMEIIKGKRAMPQQRPPYPAIFGLWDKPTVINNLETLLNVPMIVEHGATNYKKVGTQNTPGTKLLTVYGPEAGAQPHLIEVPFGTSARLAVHHADIMLNDKIARGVVIGGPEGGVIPFVESDLLLDFETVERAGTIIGSGTLEVLPPNTCMVAWAEERSRYLAGESCGKCVPCRMGVKRIAGTLETIMSDLGSQDDLGLLEEFSRYVPDGSLCGFGVHAPNAVKTAMRYFDEDFRLHIHEQRCPTGTCVPQRVHRFVKKHVL